MKKNTKFKKSIGFFSGISLVAGMVIGSGVYYLGSYVLQRTEYSFGLALVCWLIGGLISTLGGLCFAELGASRPVSGGMTVYLTEAYSPALGFINGFSSFILNNSGSIASLAMAAVIGVNSIFDLSDLGIKMAAIFIIVFFTIVNLLGVKYGIVVSNITMVLRLIPLFLIIFLGVFMGKYNPDLSISFAGTSVDGKGIVGIISMIAYATFASLWAYDGWTNLNTVGEEIIEPEKNIPRSIIFSMLLITGVYILFNYAIYRLIPADEIISMIEAGQLYVGNEVAQRYLGDFGHILVVSGMTIGIIGMTATDILVFPRTYYAMAQEGYFPKKFKNVDEKTGVPVEATIASSIISIILVVFNDLQQLTDYLITLSSLLNVLCIIAVIIYRKKYPDLNRPYKVWGGIPMVIITSILFIILVINQFIEDPRSALFGLLVPLIGYIVYLYYKKKNNGKEYKTLDE